MEEKGPQESKIKQLATGFLVLLKNPCTRWLFLGGFFRFWETTTISFYCLLYFDYFNKPDVYSTLNACVVLFGGFSSSLIAGRISDRYESIFPKTKSYVCTIMSLLGAPLFLFVFLFHFNFYFAMIMLFFENLLSEGWMGPCIAMIQTVIEVKYKAVSVGVFFFGTAIAQTLSAVIVGQLISAFDLTAADPESVGAIMFFNTALPCLLAAGCFYMSAEPYDRLKCQMAGQKIKALNIAESEGIMQQNEGYIDSLLWH